MSKSEFKTLLRRLGHDFSRDSFSKNNSAISYYKGRAYRWSSIPEVDISCNLDDFDRWANSVDQILPIKQILRKIQK